VEGEFPPHYQAILWTPAGCPTIQLNSDTLYLEIASDPTGLGVQSYKAPSSFFFPLQMPVTSPGSHLYFYTSSCKSEIPIIPSSGSINLPG